MAKSMRQTGLADIVMTNDNNFENLHDISLRRILVDDSAGSRPVGFNISSTVAKHRLDAITNYAQGLIITYLYV